jgi:hypothetical protein
LYKKIQYKNIKAKKLFLTFDLDIVNINRDGFALGVILLVCKNGLYDMKMGNLICLLFATPTIPTIHIVNPMAP